MKRSCTLFLACFLVSCSSVQVERTGGGDGPASSPEAELSLSERLRELEPLEGFVPLYWDAGKGRVLLEVPSFDTELLYLVSLPPGVGSNAIGLDRGQLGPQRVVRFERVGPRVLLVAPNVARRTSDTSDVARRAVRDSFAAGVVWGFDIEAEEDGRVLVDATDFALRDAHGIARRIRARDQGEVKLDASRSSIWLEGTRAFPDNTELEVRLTFVGERPGRELVATAADPRAFSVRVRHSFVRLPDLESSSFEPRAFDPRSGFYGTSWTDAAARPDEAARVQVVQRHRLTADEPIVYYVDRAAPEPVRTALLEGARYWQPVFAKAGFPNGFQVELLPEDADPQDIRFNVIQWVLRSTRGWSYGTTVTDPRTGEILKGHVTLGALRVRQDVLLAEGLLSPYETDADDPRVLAMALARIRQLSAHEVGHTLGLMHNFAASASERASVMDYPPPRVTIGTDGSLGLEDAYAPGCGAWDELAIRYGYAELDAAGLADHLQRMERSGIAYLSDDDARGNDRAHPLANLWDDGADPVAALEHALDVRRIALARFSRAAIRPGDPEAKLEEVLVPLYFHHRYQLEAAVRQLGGVDYRHAVRGGEPAGVRPVEAATQRRALEVVSASLAPEVVAVPEHVRKLIPPRAPGSNPVAERFDDRALLFDATQAEAACVGWTLDLLLDPVRAARLYDQNRRNPQLLGFDEVCERLIADAFAGRPAAEQRGELRMQLVERLIELASRDDVPERVRRVAHKGLLEIQRLFGERPDRARAIEEQRSRLVVGRRIQHYLEDPLSVRVVRRDYELPPGSPIGMGCGQARRVP